MSINARYYDYLDHFGQTVTLAELHQDRQSARLVALRHDVDYDLDFALEMAHWENQRGFRSTYYLLHTAPYWSDPRLIEKCLQLQDFGHEVGLHVNLLSEWMQSQINDVKQRLSDLLLPLRDAGVRITGAAAHGDRLCYEHSFSNYWIFRELRPPEPASEESGRTAEGPRVENDRAVTYPPAHYLKRDDGQRLALWSISMKQHELEYHAWHVPHDHYFSDSGGSWSRTDDPLSRPLSAGRIQVLMHPIYWRGPQKYYFFLSAARSGSKWLTNFVDQATSCRARHEFMLNHRYVDDKLVAEKRTAAGFTDLATAKDPGEARELFSQARAYLEKQNGDQAEANVYLDRFLPTLRQVFPEAIIVHLARDPKDVVRSILNRDWYDTPEDKRHPPVDAPDWAKLSRFEKACWYARRTNETLLEAAHRTLVFERMVRDLKYLTEQLRDMGIAVYPRLAADEHAKKINVARKESFPRYDDWIEAMVRNYHEICDPVLSRLGYGGARAGGRSNGKIDETLAAIMHAGAAGASPKLVSAMTLRDSVPEHLCLVGCSAEPRQGHVEIVCDPQRHAHLMFAGGSWNRLRKIAGWITQPGHYYRGSLDAGINDNEAAMFCLMYDRAGDLLEKRSLGALTPRCGRLEFTFRVRSDAQRFNLALYVAKSAAATRIQLRELRLEMLPLFDNVSAAAK